MAPAAPLVEKVNISHLSDTSKKRDVPFIAEDVYYKGIETWRRAVGHGLEDPEPAIRPSIGQYIAFMALVTMGSTYADFCLCAPWDTRTGRSKKWKGLIAGADGQLQEDEKGDASCLPHRLPTRLGS